MQQKRMLTMLLTVTAILIIFTCRLLMIQLANHHVHGSVTLTKAAVKQRARSIMLDDGRAQFVDRRGQSLTGKTVYRVALFPDAYFRGNSLNALAKIANILQISTESWESWTASIHKPAIWRNMDDRQPIDVTKQQADQINQLRIPGLRAVPMTQRYYEPYVAAHVLGFIGEHPDEVRKRYERKLSAGTMSIHDPIGVAGLERTLDRWVQGIGNKKVSTYVDALDRPIRGLSVRMVEPDNIFYPLKVVTTLDQPIQRAIEQMLDEDQEMTGAVVVLDARTADIVAMVSRPGYNPNKIEMTQQHWLNRAVKAVAPGSIFKTVTAAAALEYGLTNQQERFQCNGHLGKYRMTCWHKAGHGMLSLREAYAESCNITFAQLAMRLTGEQMTVTAQKLGLLQPVGTTLKSSSQKGENYSILDGEEAGVLFLNHTDGQDEGTRVQSAIGQRDVQLSPLQAANLVVTLLHNGEVKRPRIVKEIRYQTNGIKTAFPQETLIARRDGISVRTAATLRSWMRGVVTSGTGKQLNDTSWHVAGKSGTAQTEHKKKQNEWFIGYGPIENPRYAVAVFIENEPNQQGHKATNIFGKTMDLLAGL